VVAVSKCLCVYYKRENGKIVKVPDRCRKSDLIRDINHLLIRGWDSEYISGTDTNITIWARDEYDELDNFDIYSYAVNEILAGNDDFRRELRKEYREFLSDKDIVGIHISDAFMECCYGTDEICDFDEMIS